MGWPTRISDHGGIVSGEPRPRRAALAAAGFTYVGLLITIALMTSSLAVVAPVWEVANRRNKEAELMFVGGEFRRALVGYAKLGSSDADRYPKTLEDLVKDPRFPGNRRFLRKVYRDPITESTDWGLEINPQGGIVGVFSKSEAEPIKKTNFSKADAGLAGKTKYSEWIFGDKPVGAVPKDDGALQKPADAGARTLAPTSPFQGNTGQPTTGQPTTGQPSTGQPSTGQPSTGQPFGGQPASGQPGTIAPSLFGNPVAPGASTTRPPGQ